MAATQFFIQVPPPPPPLEDPMAKGVAAGIISYAEDLPVTIVVTRKVKEAKNWAYEDWIEGIAEQVAKFEGFEGVNVIRPMDGSRNYTIIIRFSRASAMEKWVDSDIRKEWLAKAEPLCETAAEIKGAIGLEGFFIVPGGARRPPPRYKMALVTFIAVYPCLNILGALLVPHLLFLPGPLRFLVVCSIMIPTLTWFLMPFLTQRLGGWLFKG